MNADLVTHLSTQALYLVVWLSLPALLVALLVGVLISLVQAMTQIQEMTLTFVPKIFAVFLSLAFALPWMLRQMILFTQNIYQMIPHLLD